MRIGLYGGVANNMYVMAKALAETDHQVTFVRDVWDNYPFSQPVWEDMEFTLTYEEVADTDGFSRERWQEKEQLLGWIPPPYVKTPPWDQAWMNPSGKGFIGRCMRALARMRMLHLKHVNDLLAQNDLLIVCGIDGAILASRTGLPYIIWPHGGDIRLAAGLGSLPEEWRSQLITRFKRALLKRAFMNANFVGSHDPTGIGGHIGNMSFFLERLRFGWLPIPLKERRRDERCMRLSCLNDLLSSLMGESVAGKLSAEELICFIPSRVDFFWKGQDRLLRALAGKGLPVFLIFAGWGQDYERARVLARDFDLEDRTLFLPVALSKPLLFKLFDSVDLVIDQFLSGSYGTSAVEAMAAGVPVMMAIDEQSWHRRGWLPPPVINVSSEQEIAQAFIDILDGKIDLDQCSQSVREWFSQTHAYGSFFRYVNPLFERIVKEHRK